MSAINARIWKSFKTGGGVGNRKLLQSLNRIMAMRTLLTVPNPILTICLHFPDGKTETVTLALFKTPDECEASPAGNTLLRIYWPKRNVLPASFGAPGCWVNPLIAPFPWLHAGAGPPKKKEMKRLAMRNQSGWRVSMSASEDSPWGCAGA